MLVCTTEPWYVLMVTLSEESCVGSFSEFPSVVFGFACGAYPNGAVFEEFFLPNRDDVLDAIDRILGGEERLEPMSCACSNNQADITNL